MRHVFLDVETQKSFEEVGGYLPAQLQISFVGICVRDGFSGEGEFQGFFEKDLPKLWPILETADVIVGFNITDFDMEALRPYYSGDVEKLNVLDLLTRFKQSMGHRISLDAIAQETLGKAKTADGLQAIKFFRNGQMRELAEYCLQDVAITRDIYDYGRRHNQVKFVNKWSRSIEAKVDFSYTPQNFGGVQMTLMGV